jgi:hypothetical protein
MMCASPMRLVTTARGRRPRQPQAQAVAILSGLPVGVRTFQASTLPALMRLTAPAGNSIAAARHVEQQAVVIAGPERLGQRRAARPRLAGDSAPEEAPSPVSLL